MSPSAEAQQSKDALLQSVPFISGPVDREAALSQGNKPAEGLESSADRWNCGPAATGYSAVGVGSTHKTALSSVELLAIGSVPSIAPVSPKAATNDRQALLNCICDDEDAAVADEAVAAEFVELLTGKAARYRASLITPGAHTDSSNVHCTAEAQSSTATAAGVHVQRGTVVLAAGSKGAAIGTGGRYSLANVGLIAAQGAGLLPGSPIPVPSVGGGAFGTAPSRPSAIVGHAARQSVHQQHAGVAGGLRVLSSIGARPDDRRLASETGAYRIGHKQQIQQLQQAPASHINANATAASHKPSKTSDTAKVVLLAPADNQSSKAVDDSSLQVAAERGSAAFKATTREQACRVGRHHVPEPNTPGPTHYHPATAAVNRHIAVAHIAGKPSFPKPASSSRTATAAIDAKATTNSLIVTCASQQKRKSQASAAMEAAQRPIRDRARQTLEAAVATRLSIADATPRLEAEPRYSRSFGLKGCHVHVKQPIKKGTAAFKATTREQRERQGKLGRPASAANGVFTEPKAAAAAEGVQPASGADKQPSTAYSSGRRGLNCCSEHNDTLTRPRSIRGPVVPFHKQTSRPASAAATACSPALDPGFYQGTSSFPCSRTCRDLSAGHPDPRLSSVPDFSKYSSRPGTCPAAVGHNMHQQPALEWPGAWYWPSAAEGCLQTDRSLVPASTEQQVQLHDTRPASATALTYARTKHAVELVAEIDSKSLGTGFASSSIGFLQQEEQQKRPVSVQLRKQRQAAESAVQNRPATAGAVLADTASTTTSNLLEAYGWRNAAPRPATSSNIMSSQVGILGLQEVPGKLSGYSSAGHATRVKGGRFSTASRSAAAKVLRVMSVGSVVPPASVAVLQPSTELSYEPNPEVLGHMHRSPGWSLPPNRIATSKKWAQLAQQAALQQ